MKKKVKSTPPPTPQKPKTSVKRRVAIAALWVGVVAGAFLCGRYFTSSQATANTRPSVAFQSRTKEQAKRQYKIDKEKRVVAYIHGNVPVTRDELAEYLIERYGAQSLNLLINRKIIDLECKKRGITITPEEVNAAFAKELAQMGAGVTEKQFKDVVLKRYRKTLYEWKEDVIRPRLLLEKLSRGQVTVTKEDLTNAYEAHYGEKRKIQMILWPIREKNMVLNRIWPTISKDAKEFDKAARACYAPSIAARAGHLDPIGRHTTGDEKLEKLIFDLDVGEVSQVTETQDGQMVVVVKCLEKIPASKVQLASVRTQLEQEIRTKKIAIHVGVIFEKLRNAAGPKIYVERFNPEDGVVPNPRTQPAPGVKPTQGTDSSSTGSGLQEPVTKLESTGNEKEVLTPPTPVVVPKGMKK